MSDITMPKMSDSMEEGRVIKWLKQEGDKVEKGEPIVEIETDKANMEYESPDAGYLSNVKYGDDSEPLPIGTVIAELVPSQEMAGVKGGAAAPAEAPAAPAQAAPVEAKEEKVEAKPVEEFAEPTYGAPAAEVPPQAEEAVAPKPPTEAPAPPEGVKASPLARRIAQDAGIDLSQIRGTGPGGRITEADVRDYLGGKPAPKPERPAEAAPAPRVEAPQPPKEPAAPPIPAPGPAKAPVEGEVEMSNIRKTVARRMTQSKTTIPHFYVTSRINMDKALALHEQLKEAYEELRIGVTDMLVKACARALMEHPDVNSSYQDGKLIRHSSANVAVAVALEDGLIAPVVKDADKKSLVQISRELKELVDKARSGRIKPDEYSGATFTISNLGMFDVESFLAVVVPPEAAILAVGTAYPTPIIENDEMKAARIMMLTLSADHRITDGAGAARFLQTLKKLLQTPLQLME